MAIHSPQGKRNDAALLTLRKEQVLLTRLPQRPISARRLPHRHPHRPRRLHRGLFQDDIGRTGEEEDGRPNLPQQVEMEVGRTDQRRASLTR